MCGRFALFFGPEGLAKHFGVTIEDVTAPDRYNIAPTQPVLIVRHPAETDRQAAHVRWGLIPSWAKDASIGNRQINARAETAPERPAFRSAFKARRCLIPASGFYEWQATGGKHKQPYYVHARSGEPLAFAGLWERWRPSKDESPVESCTILTTDANATMAPIHDRMPIILAPGDYATWLGESPASPDDLRSLLRPRPMAASSPSPSRPRSTVPDTMRQT